MSEALGVPSWCRVGAKVVCVDDTLPDYTFHDGNMGGLTRGAIYTIAAVGLHPFTHRLGVVLQEIVRRENVPFHIARFRPLVTDSEELGIETVLDRAKARKSKAPARESEPVE